MYQYFNSEHADVSMMADEVVFTIMATGQEHHGPEGVRQIKQGRGYFETPALMAQLGVSNG